MMLIIVLTCFLCFITSVPNNGERVERPLT